MRATTSAEALGIDVGRARRETPGAEAVVHLNNAGASLMPQVVLGTVVEHLELEARIGGYEAAASEAARIEGVYDSIARLLGCAPEEVAVIENATRAWDMAFYSIELRPGDRMLTTQAEYASNYIALLQVAQRTGAVVEVVPNDESGQVSLPALERALEGARLVSLVHVPSHGGLVQPAAAVGRLCREAGVLFLLDACQSVGQLPIDVDVLGCDMLSATGRKFLRGPRGTGFLYVRRELIEELQPPFLDLHSAEWVDADRYEIRSDARRFENWETNCAAKLGLGAAVDYALGWGLPAIAQRVEELAERLRDGLRQIAGVAVRDLGVPPGCAIVTFTVDRAPAGEVALRLSQAGINVSVAPASYSRLDLEARGIDAAIRASVHYYNTADELDRLLAVVSRDRGVSEPTPSGSLRGAAVLRDPLVRELLEARLIAVLATLEPDGSVHAVAIWYAATDDAIVFGTGSRSRKVRNLERDSRATVVLHDSRPGFEVCGVSIRGRVDVVGGAEGQALVARVHHRYLTP